VENSWLYEEGRISLQLLDSSLNASLQLALNESILRSLSSSQLVCPGCLIKPIYSLNFTNFHLNMTENGIQITALEGDIEKELDEAINNFLSLFTGAYREAIPVFINYMVVTFLQGEINDQISSLLNEFDECPDPK